MKLRPTKRALFILSIGVMALLAVPFYPLSKWYVVVFDISICLLLLYEAFLLKQINANFMLKRFVPTHTVQALPQTIQLTMFNKSKHPIHISLYQQLSFIQQTKNQHIGKIRLSPGSFTEQQYSVTYPKRGTFQLTPLYCVIHISSQLLEAVIPKGESHSVTVFPTVSLSAAKQRTLYLKDKQLGSHKLTKIKGIGREFHQLREYIPGDALHFIHWKTTAKKFRPITKEFEPEKSQTIIFCLDISRNMAQTESGISKLDAALQAILITAHQALRAGDRVGLIVFADKILHYLPPQKHYNHYNALLTLSATIEHTNTNSNFKTLVHFLHKHIYKRSLFMLVTDIIDSQDLSNLPVLFKPLQQKHNLCLLSFFDKKIHAILSQPPVTKPQVYTKLAANDLTTNRKLLITQLRKLGIAVIESTKQEIAIDTLKHYSTLKELGSL